MTIFLVKIRFLDLGGQGGVRNGPFEGDLAIMFFSVLFACFPFLFFPKKKFIFPFFCVFLFQMFHC